MKLLALETATEACSVALWIDGEVHERFEVAPRRHAELTLPWAEQLLAEAGVAKSQLDAIAVGRGPGAFTGVRLAIALGQGIALALDRPMLGISTLAALALAAGDGHVLAAIDARMSEVYLGEFDVANGDVRALGAERLVAPGAADILAVEGACWRGVGTGFSALDGALQARFSATLASVDATALPRAGHIARLGAAAFARGEALPPERVEPAYLRNNVALTLAEQQALRDTRA